MHMTLFLLLFAVFFLGDVYAMKKNNHKNALLPYIIMSAFALTVGIIYLANPYQNTIAYYLLRLFKGSE